jgi:uncharacterized membrane protein
MFEHSKRAVGNLALRRQLLASKTAVQRGDSFADALRKTPFIPRGMVTDVRVNELCGKLELSFHGFAKELRKLIEAKLEPIKAYATASIITYGLLTPLMIVLPVFIRVDWLKWYLMIIVGDLWLVSSYMAIVNYRDKRIGVNCWWEGLRDTEDMPQ